LESGFNPVVQQKEGLKNEIIDAFELNEHLGKKTQNSHPKAKCSGPVMAFSLLYGSQINFMDEPVFAMEEYQKHKTLEYVTSYSKENGISFLYSAHELELSQKYSQNTLLFYKDQQPVLGASKVLVVKRKSRRSVSDYLTVCSKQKENLFRQGLETRDFSPENKDRLL
jgi:ABC-type cobalamin/Fe3+-siderophores transport system ATPase subunit